MGFLFLIVASDNVLPGELGKAWPPKQPIAFQAGSLQVHKKVNPMCLPGARANNGFICNNYSIDYLLFNCIILLQQMADIKKCPDRL